MWLHCGYKNVPLSTSTDCKQHLALIQIISHFHVTHDHVLLPNCVEKLTNECLFFISSAEPVAPGEERVRICCIKPAKVAQIYAQPHLERGKGKEEEQWENRNFLLVQVLGHDTLVANAAAFA